MQDTIKYKAVAAAALLKDQCLVVICGHAKEYHVSADCFIYDSWSKHLSVTPSPIDMLAPHEEFTIAVLDGKVVVAGGLGGCGQPALLSTKLIDVNDLL